MSKKQECAELVEKFRQIVEVENKLFHDGQADLLRLEEEINLKVHQESLKGEAIVKEIEEKYSDEYEIMWKDLDFDLRDDFDEHKDWDK